MKTKLYCLWLFLGMATCAFASNPTLVGSNYVCPSETVTYTFDDDNPDCSSIVWEIYENGVQKPSGYIISSNQLQCTVTWSKAATSGQVKARGYNRGYYDFFLYA